MKLKVLTMSRSINNYDNNRIITKNIFIVAPVIIIPIIVSGSKSRITLSEIHDF